MVSTNFTLKAFEIVEVILSRIKPPPNVPKIPQTIVIPPNNKSALLCQKSTVKGEHSQGNMGLVLKLSNNNNDN